MTDSLPNRCEEAGCTSPASPPPGGGPCLCRDHATARIRADNDEFRGSGGGPMGFFLLTAGVRALSDLAVLQILELVRTYDTFTPDNDPHGEHDFGRLTLAGEVIYWKIDYYDEDLNYYHDPRTPGGTRVLTVLLASEY